VQFFRGFAEISVVVKKMKIILKIKFAIICFFCAAVFGCGYAFAPQGGQIDSRIQKVYVEPFYNKTSQGGIENYVRTAFINLFLQHSRFKVVESMDAADATVKGSILNINTSSLSYNKDTLAAEERAKIILEVTFREKESGKIIWSSKNMTGSVDYALDSDINLLPATRRQAFIKLANDTAEKAFNLMLSGF
jgi:hypothetical protein